MEEFDAPPLRLLILLLRLMTPFAVALLLPPPLALLESILTAFVALEFAVP